MHKIRTALGGEGNTTMRPHSLGAGINKFAATVERWNELRRPPLMDTSVVVPTTRATTTLPVAARPPCLKRQRFLDNGEGKICVDSIS